VVSLIADAELPRSLHGTESCFFWGRGAPTRVGTKGRALGSVNRDVPFR